MGRSIEHGELVTLPEVPAFEEPSVDQAHSNAWRNKISLELTSILEGLDACGLALAAIYIESAIAAIRDAEA